MPPVVQAFADGLLLEAGLASPFFVTDPSLRVATLDGPRVAACDGLLSVPDLAGPDDPRFRPDRFLKCSLLPAGLAKGPAVVFCREVDPATRALLVVRKLRGIEAVVAVVTPDVEVAARGAGARLLTSAEGFASPEAWGCVRRIVVSPQWTWMWSATGRAPDAPWCAAREIPLSPKPIDESFQTWNRMRRDATAAPFRIPAPGALPPAFDDVDLAAGPPPNSTFAGHAAFFEAGLTPATVAPLATFVRAVAPTAGTLLLVFSRREPDVLDRLRELIRGVRSVVLTASLDDVEDLMDVAVATNARPWFSDFGLPIAAADASCLGCFSGGRLEGRRLFLEGAGDANACRARLQEINANYVLAEADGLRQEIAQRCGRFVSALAPGVRAKVMRDG